MAAGKNTCTVLLPITLQLASSLLSAVSNLKLL